MSRLSLRRHSRGLGLSPRRRPAKGGTPVPTVIQQGLVAEWRFDDGSGQVLTDYSGNGHHGTLGSSSSPGADDPTWTAQGLSFGSGTFVSFAGNLGIAGTQARSVVLVLNTTGLNRFAVEWIGNATSGRRWTFRDQASGDDLRLEIQGAGHSSGLDLTNAWRFAAVTQSGANINTGVMYLDGNSAAITTSATINTAGNFSMMTLLGAAYGAGCVLAYGLVYNRALAAVEIEQNRQILASILTARGIALP